MYYSLVLGIVISFVFFFFFSSRRRHTRWNCDCSSDVCSSDLPVVSPDGTRIVFTSLRDGNFEIYTMSTDGSNVTRLTSTTAVDIGPAWSPDGSRIAFSTNRDGGSEERRVGKECRYGWAPEQYK